VPYNPEMIIDTGNISGVVWKIQTSRIVDSRYQNPSPLRIHDGLGTAQSGVRRYFVSYHLPPYCAGRYASYDYGQGGQSDIDPVIPIYRERYYIHLVNPIIRWSIAFVFLGIGLWLTWSAGGSNGRRVVLLGALAFIPLCIFFAVSYDWIFRLNGQ
jgi:hypothetical protein